MIERLAGLLLVSAAFVAAADAPPARADRALLEAVNEAGRRAIVERALATRLLAQARVDRSDEALAAAARAAGEADAARLGALRVRLRAAWREAAALLGTRWPVDPRLACRAQAAGLRQALARAGGAPLPPTLTPRVEAQRCLDRLAPVVERLGKANRAFQLASEEARAALGPAVLPVRQGEP